MPSTNPEENIFREVAKKSDIVRVVSYYLGASGVQRKGKRYVSLCPFHNDSHPSMTIDPERNNFHCYVCDSKGDSISFVEKYAKLSPLEALKKVCEICSIPVPSTLSFQARKDVLRETYPKELDALLELSRFYRLYLRANDGQKARDYLEARHIPAETIEHFGIGFAPFDPTLSIKTLRGMGYDVPTLQRAGILSASADIKDRYEGRIMFPIADNDGHIVGFSGRRFLEGQEGGKYVNFPETALFKKSSILYHYYDAKETARRDGYLYVVEGFMDAIAMQRAGINSVVALMGTALTEEHCQAFKRLGVEIRLFLDSDEAGQIGEERVLKTLLENEIPVRICWKLEGGKDADEVLTNKGAEELVRQANRLYDETIFLLGRRLNGRKALTDTGEIESYLESIKPYFGKLSEVRKAKDLGIISKRTMLSESQLTKILEAGGKATDGGNKPTVERQPGSGKYRYKKRSSYQNDLPKPIVVAEANLSGPYTAAQTFNNLLQYLLALHAGNGLDANLQKVELQIAMTLPQSREAYQKFLQSRIVFADDELNGFADLVGNRFLTNPQLLFFAKEDYDWLLSSLDKSAQQQGEPTVGEDAFDLEDMDGPVVNFNEPTKDFLRQMVQLIPNDKNVSYVSDNFQKTLAYAKAMLALKAFEDECKMRKTSGESHSAKELVQHSKLILAVKKARSGI